MQNKEFSHLDELESTAIYILREAYANFRSLGMLWSIGKDSTVMLWLTRKAFFGHVPFPLIHIDTHYKIPEMIEFRDNLVRDWKLRMFVGANKEALRGKQTFPDGAVDRVTCCKYLKTEALVKTIDGTGERDYFDHTKGMYVPDPKPEPFQGIIAGIRADEEGSRSKERYFSPRNTSSYWDISEQPPEFWSQFKTDFAPGTHVRIHPLLDWTELNIWEYIKRESIPVVPLYFSRNGKRYRSLGCEPCTGPIESDASNVDEIIEELRSGRLSNIAERSGRAQDKDDGGGLETLRKEGYM
ncbi:sulfate adenylyltransferase subunit CysD [Limisalsivibrio acetivorans]|uniref:sulfate adenylyltransferase subunit CysD n=1 Tax=Limisalsivibrio acetivorans TaxID=1304888 RepID=UPI0003B74BDD|nr:sulfate adenylyltransferase subunit CysD [Limisalsivibrio acetivorans]